MLVVGSGATRAELDARVAPFLSAAEPTAGPVLADLRTRGWLEHDADTLRVSETGREAHARLHSAVTATRERLTAGLTAEQYVATVGVLRQMALNLGWTQI